MTYHTIAERKEILRCILRGESESAFERYGVSDLDRALLLSAADRLLATAASRTSPIKGFYRMRRRMPLRYGYLLASVAAALPFGAAAYIMCSHDLTNAANYPLAGASATLLGVFAAALGWGVTSWTSHRNARAQHTINYLAQRFSNSTFSDQAALFNRYFAGKIINLDLIKSISTNESQEAIDALQALRYILNWFEFIAVGVSLGDLDIEIVTKTIRSNLILYTDRCLPYITEVRRTQPRVLENLIELRSHFQDH